MTGVQVLCANSPLNISYFQAKGLAYIGSPWGELHGRGGSGGLSLRNRTVILQLLEEMQVLYGASLPTPTLPSLTQGSGKESLRARRHGARPRPPRR